MAIEITQAQQDSINQTLRNLHIKIDILDFTYQPIDSLEGNVISGNITNDANSDLRRSCNISLVVTDSSFNVEAGGKIYLDKLIKIQVGIDEIKTGEIAWNNMGIFLINQPSYKYDAITHTLSFDGVDLMGLFTGLRNGYIANMSATTTARLQQGQNVRELIIGILKQNGFNNYVVNECVSQYGIPSQTITWDGNTTGKDVVSFTFEGAQYDMCRVSDVTPHSIDLIGGTVSTDTSTSPHTITYSDVNAHSEVIVLVEALAMIALKDGAKVGEWTFPHKGLYLLKYTEDSITTYTNSITFGGHGDEIQPVPYDIDFGQGATWYDMLSALRDILPNYQMYFDVNGVFHYEPIPSTNEDPIMLDESMWANNVLSEQVDVDFESVKNYIEVYGCTHDTKYFSDATVTTLVNNTLSLTVDSSYADVTYTQVSFVVPSGLGNYTVLRASVNGGATKDIVNADGSGIDNLEANTYYTMSLQPNGKWLFMGHLQAQGIWYDDNPESPFYYLGSIGSIVTPLYGGEYENIQTDALAIERAKYEGYKRCRLNDSITLSTIPIYWADVNWKCEYTPLGGDVTNQYIVQSIRTDLAHDGQQTWTLSRFYPLYPVL